MKHRKWNGVRRMALVLTMWLIGSANGATLFHWTFDGALGGNLTSDTDVVGSSALTRFQDSSYTSGSSLTYGAANPWFNTGGASADFTNPSSDPGFGLLKTDPGPNSNMDLSGVGAFTIEAFVYPRATRQAVIVRKSNDAGAGQYYIDTRATGKFGFDVNGQGGSGGYNVNDLPYSVNTWYHVALVWDGNALRFYVNGVQAQQLSTSTSGGSPSVAFNGPIADSGRSLAVGAITRDNLPNNCNAGQFFNGLIDELRISDVALPTSQFLLYANPLRLFTTRSGGNVIISWPASFKDCELQSRPDLSPLYIWSTVLDPATVSNNLKQVTLQPAGQATFFRLAPRPAVSFDAPLSSGDENVSQVSIPVSLSAASDVPVTVNYAVTGGTATGGGMDYDLADGTLTFNPGETGKSIKFTIVDDQLIESPETIVISLTNALNATLVEPSTHTYTILDNDSPPAGRVLMQCDVGNGPIQSGWVCLPSCGTYDDVNGSGISVTLATGNPGACASRNPGGSGALADVEADLLFADNETGSPGADFVVSFGNLTPGATYRLSSYHHRSDEAGTVIPGVIVSGATVVSRPDSIVQSHDVMDSPAQIIFTADSDTGEIRYLAPLGGCPGCQAFLNGFVLELLESLGVQFESVASKGLEAVSPALLQVTLTPAQTNVVTVDYSVIGGTASNGVDYSLLPGTLTFNPGETNQFISIPIVNDGLDEEDETIEVGLSNPTGGVSLGFPPRHTYTILDPRPAASFLNASGSGSEGISSVSIPVSLSVTGAQPVSVNYAVTGGTATGGGVDYALTNGTLFFDPGVTTQYLHFSVVDDSMPEPPETILLGLSSPTNGRLGAITQYTYTIVDNDQGVVWDGLTWYYSASPNLALFVNAQDQLEWRPEKGQQITVRLPDYRLSEPGDTVTISYVWMTDGEHDCADCFACPGCFDNSITCIAGTSDMRVGLFQADGEYVTGDGYPVSNSSIWAGYKGYEFRFGPNMLSGPTRWVDCTGEVHKTGNFAKKPASLSNLMYSNDGLTDYIPGFELPPGQFSPFTISLQRLSASSVRLSITLNGRTYTWTDNSATDQPQKIDVLAIHMRNGRPYSRLVLAKP